MFDIGFTELMVVAVVALLVVGPERLPRVARTAGALIGRLQRYVADVKADINREVELEELRKMKDSVQQAASEFETSMNEDLRKAETDLNRSVADAAAEPKPETTPEPPAALDKPDAPEARGASQ
ncbi:MAG: Sec-independent protein translocase protein TatB [bacterium]|jgi:sec-independent protein translocase protein TatB